jgi:hypothetical protein
MGSLHVYNVPQSATFLPSLTIQQTQRARSNQGSRLLGPMTSADRLLFRVKMNIESWVATSHRSIQSKHPSSRVWKCCPSVRDHSRVSMQKTRHMFAACSSLPSITASDTCAPVPCGSIRRHCIIVIDFLLVSVPQISARVL